MCQISGNSQHAWLSCGYRRAGTHFFFAWAFLSSRPSGLLYWTLSPIFVLPNRFHRVSGSPLGSVASLVLVSAVSTKLEFCKEQQCQGAQSGVCGGGRCFSDTIC